MSLAQTIPIVLFGLAGILGLLVVISFSFDKLSSKEKREIRRLLSMVPSKDNKIKAITLGQKLYPILYNMPLVKVLLLYVRRRLEVLQIGEDREIREKSAQHTLMALISSLLIIIFALSISANIYTKMSILAVAFYLFFLVVNSRLGGIRRKYLYDLREFLQALKHSYHQFKMVSLSLRVSADYVNNMSSVHARRIADALSSLDPDTEILSYYDIAPNKHLKKLADICHTVQQYGDDDESSQVFLAAIDNIIEEIQIDITNLENLRMRTFGTTFMSIFPVFIVEPIRRWTENSFPEASSFYNSKLGFYSLVAIYVLTVISILGSTMTRNLGTGEPVSVNEGRIVRVLMKYKPIRRLMSRVAPTDGKTIKSNKILRKTEPLLANSSSRLTVKEFYLQKVIWGILSFVVSIVVFINSHEIQKITLLDETAYDLPVVTASDNYEKQRRIFESEAIKTYANSGIGDEKLFELLVEGSVGKAFSRQGFTSEEYAYHVLSRIREYENERFMWYEVLIAFGISAIFYNFPTLFLQIRAYSRRMERQDEVDGFYSILSIMSKFDRMMVKDLLEKMHRYSVVFKEPLNKCILNYASGSYEALEELKDEVRFVPMERIVDRLQVSEKISVKDAFSDLDGDRVFSIEQRKIQNEKSLSFRVTLSTSLAWIPFGALLIGYLVLPFAVFMVENLSQVNELFYGTGG